MRRVVIPIIVVVVLVIGFAIWLAQQNVAPGTSTSTGQTQQTQQAQDQANEQAVRNVVTAFGTNLKNVSLLAPQATLDPSLQTNYGPYVSPTLLNSWIADSSKAPGRLTSSPWPDRIDITQVTKNDDGTYTVQGNIIEVTSQEVTNGGVAAQRPITLTVSVQNNAWLITAVTLGDYTSGSEFKTSTDTAHHLSFQYQDPFPATYIHPQNWPPTVTTSTTAYSCKTGGNQVLAGGQTAERTINGRTYCVTEGSEGAAGSIYNSYTYTTESNGTLVTLTFTLREVQCANYDDPQKTQCTQERQGFDVDALADRIVQSVKSTQ